MANLIFSVIIIHVQVCKYLVQAASKKKIDSINLLNTLLVLTSNVLKYFVAMKKHVKDQR